jgi:hypothetical protein
MLVAARFVQGLGGALSSAVILAILATEFPDAHERTRAMSLYTFVSVAGGSVGLLAGGALTQAIDWHWIFFVNVPIGLLTALAVRSLVEARPGIGLGEGIDVLGAIVVTSAMALGVYAIVEAPSYGWASLHTLGFGSVAAVALAAFLALEARLENPILPLRLLRMRTLAGSSVVRAMMGMGMYGSFFLGALYLERVQGYGSVATGEAFLPWTLVVAALSVGPTSKLVRRFGAGRPLLAGLVIMAGGLLVLSTAGAGDPYFPTVFVAFLLMGPRCGDGVHAAADDRHGRRAGTRRRRRLGAGQRLALHLRGARPGRARRHRDRPHPDPDRAGPHRRPRPGRRLPAGLRRRLGVRARDGGRGAGGAAGRAAGAGSRCVGGLPRGASCAARPLLHHRGKRSRGASSVRDSAIVARRAEGGLSKRP